MARIRTIKPEFFTSEDIVALTPLARLLYIALWCESDREGRMVWKPSTFKLRYLPADNCDVHALCDEILSRNLVILYNDGLAYIPSFASHQHINPRESASQLASPNIKPRVGTRQPRVGTGAYLELHAQVGREGKGREINTDASTSDGFALFWSAYPKKTAKPSALTAFKKAKINGHLPDVLSDIEQKAQSDDWTKNSGQFIPNPATYLNQRRWEDITTQQTHSGVIPGAI
jgi:hypothetical protein